MTPTTISVAYVNAPTEGRKRGSIKTTEGAYYGVLPNQIGLFRPGASYEIEFSERNWNGRTYRDITKCRPQQPPRAVDPPPTGSCGLGGVSAPPSQGTAVSDHNHSDATESYLTTLILAAKIQACHIGRDEDLAPHWAALREQYRRGFG